MPRLSQSDQLAVRDTIAHLAVLGDGEQIGLASVRNELERLIPAQFAVVFSLESTPTQVRVSRVSTSNGVDSHLFAGRLDTLLSRQPTKFTAWNAQRPEPWQRNKVVSVVDYLGWERMQQLPIFQHVVVPMHWDRYHQLRALSCEEESLLAWVGIFREEPFTMRESMMLQGVLPAIQRRLGVDLRFQQAKVGLSALDVTLEALGAPAFIVRAGPVVVHVNSAGRAMLDRDRVGTLEGLQRATSHAPEAPARAFAIPGSGVAGYCLCIWLAARADMVPRAASLARRHGLTPRETEVLLHLARGKPNKLIAAELGRAQVTIEVHVGALLAKTGCGSRAELVARFWAGDG